MAVDLLTGYYLNKHLQTKYIMEDTSKDEKDLQRVIGECMTLRSTRLRFLVT